MSETFKIFLMIFFVIGTFILSLFIAGWKMKRASDFIIRDLKKKKAFDPASSVELPYSKSLMFRLGLRDYRPKAMEQLVRQDVIRLQEGDRYYLGSATKK